jgi:4-hydroxy-tetrahydrodipicolinate synthase
MVVAVDEGRWDDARALHLKMLEIHSTMFIDSNPVPVKTALSLMGKIDAHVRLPLAPLSAANLARLTAVMKGYGLI